MLEDQVAFLLQRYLGNYVRGLNKEALKISVWKGDVELSNMQLRPEALNALKLPVRVKAGFLGSVKLKVPWSRLGQEPVLVSLDRIFILAEPATQVEGCDEEAIQEAKKTRVRELEMKLLESQQHFKSEMNSSWLGSLISTIIGNLKLSITNIHIRYEDIESNPGHSFAAGATLSRLSAVTVDDLGKETFATGGALDRIQKFVELEQLAFYFDSDIHPWSSRKAWEELLPFEWSEIFELESKGDKSAGFLLRKHSYILQPVSGNAKYMKLQIDEARNTGKALQNAVINLDSVTLCLSKDGYRDILKLADNFAAFNKRLKYAHYRPHVPVKSDPRSWWKYAYKVVVDEMKAASGKLSWEQVLRYTRLRKHYVSVYASLLKSDMNRLVVDDNKEIEKLDRELDINVILQWRMLAHKFVEQSTESDTYRTEQKAKRSWWSFGWGGSPNDGNESRGFTEEDWEQLNKIIGYKEDSSEHLLTSYDRRDLLHLFFEIHMSHNASKLITDNQLCLADLSCEGLDCSVKLYSEAKVFDLKLGSYKLSSPYGLLAESATLSDSLVGVFIYKPFDAQVDWSFAAKASPCYMTYLKDSVDQIVAFFKSSTAISQTIALETATAVQMTIDGVKRTAQEQVAKALKDRSRFSLDLDIAAPKITIPTKFYPDNSHPTKLLLDLGNLMLCTQDDWDPDSSKEKDLYLQFNLVLSDVSAFLVDGDYCWGARSVVADNLPNKSNVLPVVEKCGIVLKLQQIQLENPLYPSTRLAVRLPSLGFHFSPARYHRLMEVAKIFQGEDDSSPDMLRPWAQADFEGWLSRLSWKGVGNREAVWLRRYFCLVGPFLYILENPASKSYKHFISLRGKQLHQIPTELSGGVENVLVLCSAGQLNPKIVEDVNSLIIRCDSDESRRTWQSRFQGAIYRASGSAAVTGDESSSQTGALEAKSLDKSLMDSVIVEKFFVSGVLDELRICFSSSYQTNQRMQQILLGKESPLFEFRAIGGRVEVLMKANNILIGTILKSLEIEDQFEVGSATPRYLARSFIKDTEASTLVSPLSPAGRNQTDQNDDEDDKFFEASDDISNLADHPFQRQSSMSEYFTAESSISSRRLPIRTPSFNRVMGLIPDPEFENNSKDLEQSNTLDSFVKAQIIIYSQDSPLYNNIDNRVLVTLTMLTFFCHRPTILAILEFVDAINIQEDDNDYHSCVDKSSTSLDSSNINDEHDSKVEDPVVKGLLGKGKDRIIFFLTLNMAKAEIILMKEDGASIATLSQNNLLTDIKVFPASFNIIAALGNLRISDDSLPYTHLYFWVCHMRNPGGSSFVELDFSSFSPDDEDYNGFDYSLTGQLSEVRIVYLNRFVQEVVSYFTGLVPTNAESAVKLKDHVNNSERWVSRSEMEGLPAVKLDISLTNPIILMPQRTDSADYLELDVLHITLQNTFQWLGGDKNDTSAIHLEILTVKVKNINLTVGSGTLLGESIIQDVSGFSIVIQRSLRDLLHQIPTTEAAIRVEELKASLSNKEYEIITECALSNMSETPNVVPSLGKVVGTSDGVVEPVAPLVSSSIVPDSEGRTWIIMKVSVAVNLVELSLHSGIERDSPLATVQASGAWLLYKSNSSGESFLFATLRGFSVIDDREGIKEEFRLAIGKPEKLRISPFDDGDEDIQQLKVERGRNTQNSLGFMPVPSMLILDAKFRKSSTDISLCIQRPKMLVALDFLVAVIEFFSPATRNILSNEGDDPLHIVSAIIIDRPTYVQTSPEFSISPQKPLIADDGRFDHFVYDGQGGKLILRDREGKTLSSPSLEMIIYIGNGKRLQFKNVTIVNGEYLDSCILLGTNSSYAVSEDDNVFLDHEDEHAPLESQQARMESVFVDQNVVDGSNDLNIELQAIGPELTFYSASKDVGEYSLLSNKVMHANLDVFCRIVLKGDSIEISGNVLELKVESNGIRVIEPFDTYVKFSNASGKTNVHLEVSDIFMNFSFSILRLFLAVEEDILAFLRMASKKVSVLCSQFDRVGIVHDSQQDQAYAFWRPRAPSGFAILGDCLTPLNEPPSKGVIAVNTSYVRVKRPVAFKLIWPWKHRSNSGRYNGCSNDAIEYGEYGQEENCSIWYPIAPKGFVAVGCVVSSGRTAPPLSSSFCILSSLVTPWTLKDCIVLGLSERASESIAFWRVENSFGSFLPVDPTDRTLNAKPYEFRHIIFGYSESFIKNAKNFNLQDSSLRHDHAQLERSAFLNSGRLFEAVASFKLIWWNQGAASQKKLSIWRPMTPPGMVFLGDVAVPGYEPPNSAIVIHDTSDESSLKAPQDFQLVGHIRKQKGIDSISFWLPQAPPGFVALGCIASKGFPKHDDFRSLRCIRSDMVTGDQFLDESIWDASNTKVTPGPFSLWRVGNEVGTFLVRNGFKKPPKRYALKLAGPNISSGSDNMVIDAEIKTFSLAVLDDYGGLMVPLFNISFSSIGFNLHGRSDALNSTVSFSLAAKSYNDKYDAWEPLIEQTDGFLRYQYDQNAPGAATQLRMTSTKDLNLNISVANMNMIFQAYSSWNNLSQIQEAYENRETVMQSYRERSVVNVHHRKNYYIIPVNKLGQDICIRATEISRISNTIKLPSGDNRPVKVPVSKNMLDSHMKGKLGSISRSMVAIIIADAELPAVDGLAHGPYTTAIRLFLSEPSDSPLQQQSARTCGSNSEHSPSTGVGLVNWGEAFFFKVNSMDNYMVEFIVTDLGRGVPVGLYSAPLKEIAYVFHPISVSNDFAYELAWIELSRMNHMEYQGDARENNGKIRCAVVVLAGLVAKDGKGDSSLSKPGYIQISPTNEGPWTTVRLNYATPAACWRLGNDVIASEVTVKDGNRYVTMRSLVSITNNTDVAINLRLKSKKSYGDTHSIIDKKEHGDGDSDHKIFETDEFFEVEKFSPSLGWISCSSHSPHSSPNKQRSATREDQIPNFNLPEGWEWIDDWHVDKTSSKTVDGWVYALDTEHLKLPQSADHMDPANCARQRRWIRHREYMSSDAKDQIFIGLLEPGGSTYLPLSSLTHPEHSYILQLRPKNTNDQNEYSWSVALEKHWVNNSSVVLDQPPEICVSMLTESHVLFYCSQLSSGSSLNSSKGIWLCLSAEATAIGKDMHSNPIHDWNLKINSPLSVTSFLPLPCEYSVFNHQPNGEMIISSKDDIGTGETIKIYSVDPRDSLYLSVIPQGGWQPIHESVPISLPSTMPSKLLTLRNSFSGRIVQVVVEQNYDKTQLIAKVIRIYVPYWIAVARCPPLTYNFIDMSRKKERGHFSVPLHPTQGSDKILWQIVDDELVGGYTMLSILNFKHLGISGSISQPGKEQFGPVRDLSPLGDMEGSVDLHAYDTEGNCFWIFVSSKPSPYPSVPTKVISIRPYVTFTNRLGQNLYVKFNVGDQPKVLSASDSRVSFIYRERDGQEKLQVKLEGTEWSRPLEIVKEDTLTIVLRNHPGGWTFLKTEVRGYDEGSRFSIVFRLGSAQGPIRIENRTFGTEVNIRQSGLDGDAWIHLDPHSTTNFAWEDPNRQQLLDICIHRERDACISDVDLEKTMDVYNIFKEQAIQVGVIEYGDIKIVWFLDGQSALCRMPEQSFTSNWGISSLPNEMQRNTAPLELIIELGTFGISLIDHRPRELLYLYLEKVFLSYSTGYDAGMTNRFKLIIGLLQLDNQLPLTPLPVLLAPEEMPDINHPVFKATITMNNGSMDGIQVYPYVYIRVTDKCWRLNIHEPIIWALVGFYNNLRTDSISSGSGITGVDPEIRIDLIDISEIRLKLSLEIEPTQRPPGALGMWSPILSAFGNALKIQVHLRKVMHRSRFMRKSSIVPAILNRIRRDLIHNPLHLIFSIDVLGMTKSTLSSLSKGFAELSTDGQFLKLRAKQVWSRRITGLSDGILQGTEALAQGVAFGVSGVLRKPVESARQHGFLGLAHGLGRAFLGFFVQPLSGALDFVSLTVDGIGASFTRCLEVLNNRATAQRIRIPHAIHADGIIREYCEKEALGQMILYLAEASRHMGCTDLFKEPSKYAWSDYYEDHFVVPNQRIVLITHKRVMLLQSTAPDKLDKKPSKILWDVPWEEILALELAKAGCQNPSYLIIHLKNFTRSESFVRLIKCCIEDDDEQEPQAVRICSTIRRMWRAHKSDVKLLTLKVPSSQRYVEFVWDEANGKDSSNKIKPIMKPAGGFSLGDSLSDDNRFIKHTVNFKKIWSSERVVKNQCTLFLKQASDDGVICSIWRPNCPDGYVSVGDIAHVGTHPPTVASIYRDRNGIFSVPIGFDLVWRNCPDDYATPVSVWLPRAPDGFVAVGCVAVAGYEDPEPDSAYCVSVPMAEEASFEEQIVWNAPDFYPWACYIYQVQSEALHCIALRQPKEESDWRPMKVTERQPLLSTDVASSEGGS